MKFPAILERITGISTPVFGVSWNPPESEIQIAKELITNLEDRRVLYSPYELEVPDHCVHSIIEIRHILSSFLQRVNGMSELDPPIRAMRAACRKFLNDVQTDDRIVAYGSHPNHFASWHFNSALGELRGGFGIHVATLAAKYGLDVEDDLARILPAEAEDDDKDGQ